MAFVLPALVAMFAWWISTGTILYLDRLPRPTFRWSMAAATILLVIGVRMVAASADDLSVASAYTAFFGSLAIWVWLEMSFLMGFVTGPRRSAPPPGVAGWARFRCAVEVILWHEIAALAAGLLVLSLTASAPNQVGLWTFLAIWLMKVSAKLNIHLGARNLGEHLLPPHLAYLAGYFTRRAMNPLLPVSLGMASLAVLVLILRAGAADASAFEATGCILVATMLVLAILEHALLFLPLPAGRFWTLGFGDGPSPELEPGLTGSPSPALGRIPSDPDHARSAEASRAPRPILRLQPTTPSSRRVS